MAAAGKNRAGSTFQFRRINFSPPVSRDENDRQDCRRLVRFAETDFLSGQPHSIDGNASFVIEAIKITHIAVKSKKNLE